MKILIFSDSHLSTEFDEKKFNYLSSIIKNADKVVINGDFWEGFATKFDDFINSPWKRLFPFLKTKHSVYIFGNHDKKEYSDDRVNLFSDLQTERYEFTSGDKECIVEHGDKWETIMIEDGKRFGKYALISLIFDIAQVQIVKNKLTWIFFQRYNNSIKRKLRGKLTENQLLFCGHTHCAEIDLKNQFINSGVNNYGLGQYVIINEGVITAHEVWYE